MLLALFAALLVSANALQATIAANATINNGTCPANRLELSGGSCTTTLFENCTLASDWEGEFLLYSKQVNSYGKAADTVIYSVTHMPKRQRRGKRE